MSRIYRNREIRGKPCSTNQNMSRMELFKTHSHTTERLGYEASPAFCQHKFAPLFASTSFCFAFCQHRHKDRLCALRLCAYPEICLACARLYLLLLPPGLYCIHCRDRSYKTFSERGAISMFDTRHSRATLLLPCHGSRSMSGPQSPRSRGST